MRHYTQTISAARDDSRGTALLSRLWRNWMAKRSLAQLETFDDHQLRDIGLDRTDVSWAVGLPLTVNAAAALEERAFRGRRLQRRGELRA